MNLALSLHWGNAAWRESSRVGAAEIDLDHLYLGLLALGGAAARLLGRHGVSLASARARAAEAHHGSPAGDGALGLPPLRPLPELGDPRLRWTPRARALLDEVGRVPDTFAALVALLREPSGVTRRLVAADGVAPNDLVPELRAGADDPYAPDAADPDPALLRPPARAHRLARFVSVPTDRLADALADPASLAWWAYDPGRTEVTASGEQARFARGGRDLTLRYHLTRRTDGDSRTVTWLQEALTGDHAGEALLYDRFDVRPAPGGSELVRTSGRRTFGLPGRMLAPLHDRIAGLALVSTTQVIAYGAAAASPS